jgi:hypothetical protein
MHYNDIYAKRGYPWSEDDLPNNWPSDKPLYGNPWVWFIDFSVVSDT